MNDFFNNLKAIDLAFEQLFGMPATSLKSSHSSAARSESAGQGNAGHSGSVSGQQELCEDCRGSGLREHNDAVCVCWCEAGDAKS